MARQPSLATATLLVQSLDAPSSPLGSEAPLAAGLSRRWRVCVVVPPRASLDGRIRSAAGAPFERPTGTEIRSASSSAGGALETRGLAGLACHGPHSLGRGSTIGPSDRLFVAARGMLPTRRGEMPP